MMLMTVPLTVRQNRWVAVFSASVVVFVPVPVFAVEVLNASPPP
jgi:hypothetical protein